jgi:hypothetical protein
MLRYVVSLLALASLSLASRADAQTASAISSGGYVNPAFRVDGAALMKSFYFKYQSDDHHLRAIQVQPHKPSLGGISINYQDINGDDDYFYNIVSQPYYGGIFQRSTERIACKAQCTIPIARPGDPANWTFVIRGFYIYFHGDDHHIDRISLTEANGNVTAAFNDKNDDDTFWWELDYAYIPNYRFTQTSTRSGSAQAGARATIGSGLAVLRGFTFDFSSEDHHIRDVGVWMPGNGNLDVFYGDKNGDDRFTWEVRYGILGSMFEPPIVIGGGGGVLTPTP